MTRFRVGDQVTIRYGKHMGQKAIVLKSQLADVYTVRVEDGIILCYSGKGLEKHVQVAL